MSLHDRPPLVTVKSVHDDGPLALYTGALSNGVHLDLGDQIVTTSDTDLVPLAKAILNAVEPEALVENQSAAPADQVDVFLTAVVNDLQDRVANLEAAAGNEIRVGDTVSVGPDDWNIASPSAVQGSTVVGKVLRIFPNSLYGPTYWVEFKSKTGSRLTTALGAKRATKVGSRG